jgi:hypothetical protein
VVDVVHLDEELLAILCGDFREGLVAVVLSGALNLDADDAVRAQVVAQEFSRSDLFLLVEAEQVFQEQCSEADRQAQEQILLEFIVFPFWRGCAACAALAI